MTTTPSQSTEESAALHDVPDGAPAPSTPRGPKLETSAGPIQVGFFNRKEKLKRLLWMLVESTLFRIPIRRADRWRAFLLRSFGATIGKRPLIRSNVHIEVPWNLVMGDEVKLGEKVIVYNLGPITIGDRTRISQYAHLCGGSHDHTRSDMPLHRVPIRIGSDVWICADVYVAPGVVIGDGAMVGARSNVYKDLPAWMVCMGSPARALKPREFRRVEKHEQRSSGDA